MCYHLAWRGPEFPNKPSTADSQWLKHMSSVENSRFDISKMTTWCFTKKECLERMFFIFQMWLYVCFSSSSVNRIFEWDTGKHARLAKGKFIARVECWGQRVTVSAVLFFIIATSVTHLSGNEHLWKIRWTKRGKSDLQVPVKSKMTMLIFHEILQRLL